MRLKTLIASALVAVSLGSGATAAAAPAGHECATPSIDRYQQWLASGEGTTEPATGSILVPEGRHRYAAKIKFLNPEWHVMVLWLGNRFEAQADLSRSRGFLMTYSATDDLYVQLRPASDWSGGAKWVTKIPSTRGKVVSRFFSFHPDKWTTLAELGAPAYPLAEALDDARGLVFVGKTPNDLVFKGLKVDGYRPPCVY